VAKIRPKWPCRPIGKAPAAFVICLLVTSALSEAQTQAAGVSISHLAQIDKYVYVGSKPRTDQDFQFLQSRHIRYIVNARFLPFLSGPEERKAKRYGITLLSFPMNASPIPPSEKHVNQVLLTIGDKQFQPVYVHCVLGRDRTSLISGLYKIYFLGTSKSQAWQEMRESGFHTWWFVSGLRVYFHKHSNRPPALAAGT
jgi:protein tyrosine/serine phosphatase